MGPDAFTPFCMFVVGPSAECIRWGERVGTNHQGWDNLWWVLAWNAQGVVKELGPTTRANVNQLNLLNESIFEG